MSIITMINDDWASLKWSRTDNPHKGIPNEADAVNATASESNPNQIRSSKFMSHTQEVLGALKLKVVHARGSKRKQKNPVTDRTAFCGSWGGIKPAVLKAYLLGL